MEMAEEMDWRSTLFQQDNFFDTIHLFQLGEVFCEPGYGSALHRQWCFEITYIVSGFGVSRQDEKACPVKQNDVVFSPRRGAHSILADASSHLRFICLGFDVPEAETKDPALQKVIRFFELNPNLCLPDRTGIGPLLHKLLEEYYGKQEGYEDIVASGLRLTLLLALRNALGAPAQMPAPSHAKPDHGLIQSVLQYVEGNLRGRLTVQDIASALNYNGDYISHVFGEKMGETLQNYIRRRKIERGAELIRDFGITVSRAAEELGYRSVQSFSKAFRSVYGQAPRQYLEKQRCSTAQKESADADNGGGLEP